MGGPIADDALVERAQATLRRLGAAVPSTAAEATTLASELGVAWRRRPLSAGLVGDDLAARTELLDRLCGGGLLDPIGRAPGCAAIRIRRGATTLYRTTASDGKLEGAAMPPPREPGSDERPARRARVAELRDEVDAGAARAAQLERALPVLVRVRPKPWAVWLWPIRWLLRLFVRDRLVARAAATGAVVAARQRLRAAELALEAAEAAPRDPHELFVERLRVLSSGSEAGRGVKELELELGSGPLPVGVEVVELGSSWSRTRAEMDAVLMVSRDAVRVADGAPVGTYDAAVARLPALLAGARAVRLARRARELVAAEAAKLEQTLRRAEVDHGERIARLEALRIGDLPGFVDRQLEELRPQIITSVNAVLEHASVHLGAELAELASAWAGTVARAGSVDELRAAAARIDDESPGALQRVAGEVRLLVIGGVGGSAHDLSAPLVAALRANGPPPEQVAAGRRGAPALPPLDMLPALTGSQGVRIATELTGAGQWLSGLFRSTEARRAEVLDRLRERAAHVSEVAAAELLDAEPRLHAALAEVLARELRDALAHQHAALDSALARERAEIARERDALEPLARRCDQLRADARRLAESIAEHEARQTEAR